MWFKKTLIYRDPLLYVYLYIIKFYKYFIIFLHNTQWLVLSEGLLYHPYIILGWTLYMNWLISILHPQNVVSGVFYYSHFVDEESKIQKISGRGQSLNQNIWVWSYSYALKWMLLPWVLEQHVKNVQLLGLILHENFGN